MPLAAIDHYGQKAFQNQVHTVQEWIPNEVVGYIEDYPLRNKLIDAVGNYVKDKDEMYDYVDLILEYSYKKDLNPWLVASVIAKESSFNARARSKVGARGLMQIMPNWREDKSGRIVWSSRKSYSVNLYDPRTNIRFGTTILKHYLDLYKDPAVALAAYNGSKGSMRYPNAVFDIFEEEQAWNTVEVVAMM